MNLQEWKDRFLYLTEHRYGSASGQHATDALFFSLINQVQDALAEKLGMISVVDETTALESGTATYRLPGGLLGAMVDLVKIKDAAGQWPEEGLARYGWPLPEAANGEPERWATDKTDPRRIVLWPTPQRSAAASLRIVGTARPARLYRIWQPAAITAAVTFGSAEVVLSGAAGEAEVFAGDEFGVKRGAQSDESAVEGESPLLWYEIEDVVTVDDVTTLTLTEEFVESSAEAAEFVTSQVPNICAAYPGKVRLGPATLAAALFFDEAAPEIADRLRALAAVELGDLRPHERGVKAVGRRQGYHLPQFFRRW